jgi:hypothetical protein
VLELFDMLSPAYDRPRSLGQVRRWTAEAGLQEVEVHYGWNGVEARGVRPGPRGPAGAAGGRHPAARERVNTR